MVRKLVSWKMQGPTGTRILNWRLSFYVPLWQLLRELLLLVLAVLQYCFCGYPEGGSAIHKEPINNFWPPKTVACSYTAFLL